MITKSHEELLYRWIGRRVRELREGRFTQEQLADMVDVSRTSITNLERGHQRIPIHQLLRLADALGSDVHDLLPSSDDLEIGSDGKPPLNVVGPLTPSTELLIKKYSTSEGTR